MQVTAGLHLVDGMTGIVNAYVWERPGGGLSLIDAGMPADGARILAFVRSLDISRLDRIIVTHGDVDHVGGLSTVQAATGARVACHAVEKDLIEGRGRREMSNGALGRFYGALFALASERVLGYRPVSRVDELLLDKQALPEGFQVVHVPGHTPGQIALYHAERGILIAGDALRNSRDQLALPMAIATPQMEAARDSIRKLAAIKGIQVICFGHGPPITRDAEARLGAFAARLNGKRHVS
jgi:glyoxylase-like metal-dependent hydrolase (beta-lactamase superfamily II)